MSPGDMAVLATMRPEWSELSRAVAARPVPPPFDPAARWGTAQVQLCDHLAAIRRAEDKQRADLVLALRRLVRTVAADLAPPPPFVALVA